MSLLPPVPKRNVLYLLRLQNMSDDFPGNRRSEIQLCQFTDRSVLGVDQNFLVFRRPQFSSNHTTIEIEIHDMPMTVGRDGF